MRCGSATSFVLLGKAIGGIAAAMSALAADGFGAARGVIDAAMADIRKTALDAAESMRKVLGLEMEAMAIGAVAHKHQDSLPYFIVMKGVMDHADAWKSDAVKRFAERTH